MYSIKLSFAISFTVFCSTMPLLPCSGARGTARERSGSRCADGLVEQAHDVAAELFDARRATRRLLDETEPAARRLPRAPPTSIKPAALDFRFMPGGRVDDGSAFKADPVSRSPSRSAHRVTVLRHQPSARGSA